MSSGRYGKKNGFALFLLILAGIVIGGFLGSLTEGVKAMSWFDYGFRFGMKSPLAIDLQVIFFQIQLLFDINVASLCGIALAIFIYRKL